MRKPLHLAVGLAVAILAATFLTKSIMSTTGETGEVATKQPSTIHIEDLQRAIDLKALPIQDDKDPV